MNVRSFISRFSVVVTAAAVIAISPLVDARDDHLKMPLDAALARAQASGKLASGIKLFFGKQKYPKPTLQIGPTHTNKKTNFFNKTDVEGCEWAFLSSMIALTQYAQRVGGNAIVARRVLASEGRRRLRRGALEVRPDHAPLHQQGRADRHPGGWASHQ